LIVLDTHAWLWWMAAPERLSPAASRALSEASDVGISTLSVWELATLVGRRRITLDREPRDWVRRSLSDGRVRALAPDSDVALAAGLLGAETFPGDPADRLIFATARALDAPLVTRDERLRRFAPTGTIW
jgi:PIN domain nuclease of toxin-antitoxin system